MPDRPVVSHVVHFGVFEADLRSGELRKHGLKVKIQEQPFRVLAMLLEQPGHIVTREELRKKLWPADTFVDFEHGLNAAINKLRGALGDPADNPRFIETLHRRGYRFIAPLEAHHPPAPPSERRGAMIDSPPEFAGSQSALSSSPGSGGGQGEVEAVQAGAELAVPATAQQAESLREAVGSAVGAVREPPRRKRWTIAAMVGVPVTLLAALFVLNVAGLRGRLLASLGARHGAPVPKIESIAVLPLENLSHDPEQEYFADGMTEELITNLGKVSALRVISRQSTMRYKGSKKPLPEIARELNVDAVVEGTVWRSGNRVRITANLLHAPTDRHLWAETYERDLGDVLSLQSEVARAIAHEVQAKLTPQEQARLATARPVNPEVHRLCLLGRFHWNKRTQEGLEKAIDHFQQAIEIDPAYAPAYAGLGDSYILLGTHSYRVPREVIPRGKAAAHKALDLDESLAEAHTSLAFACLAYDWDWPGCEKEFKRAIELNPNYATAQHWYGDYLSDMRRHAEAITQLERAQQLDPLSPVITACLAYRYCLARQYQEAIRRLQNAAALFPEFWLAQSWLGDAYMANGAHQQAIVAYEKARLLQDGDPAEAAALGQSYTKGGIRGYYLWELGRLSEESKHRYVRATAVACLYAALGEKDKAFSYLEKAYEDRAFDLNTLQVEPRFDPLRSDPRFQDLLRRMNFPP